MANQWLIGQNTQDLIRIMQRELFGNYFSKQGVENYGRLKLL